MKTIILVLYLAVSALHLHASWLDDAAKRKKTKPLLLLLLLAFYLAAARETNAFLVAALLTSWLGDVLLIPKGHVWFTCGGISFMFSHLFFVLVYLQKISLTQIPWYVFVLAAVYFGIALRVIFMVKDTTPKKMIVPMYFYLLCNSVMNLFAFLQMRSLHSTGSVVAYLGAVLFYISDCTLFLVRYYRKPEIVYKKHFTVMLTYLLGELLITAGILMIHG